MKKKYNTKNNPLLQNFVATMDALFDEPKIPSSNPVGDVTLKQMLEAEQNKEVFSRKEYYSQTEALAKYAINRNQFNQLCIENGIKQINREIDLGGYTVTTRYVKKTEFDMLNLPAR